MRAPEPRVSVVIPTWKRPVLLRRCLLALCAQRMEPGGFEVIVADDGCERRIAQLVADLAADYPRIALRYTAVRTTQGPAGARNAGWRLARGEIVAFTDDDTVPAPACFSRRNCRSESSRQARVKRSSKPPTRCSAERRTKQLAVTNSALASPPVSRS